MADYNYKTAPGAPDNSLLDDLATAYQEAQDLRLRMGEVENYIQARRHHDQYICKGKNGVFFNIMNADKETLEELLAWDGYNTFNDDCDRVEGSRYTPGSRKAIIERRLRDLEKEAK